MAVPGYVQKTLRLKPEVEKIFIDLEAWLDYCRVNLINYNPADLYKSQAYRNWQREKEYFERKARREYKARQGY